MVRFVAFGLGLSTLLSITVACSSATEATPPQPTPKPVCPGLVDVAVASNTKCNSEGYLCGIGYQCGAFQQQAACTCTSGKFVCTTPGPDTQTIAPDTSAADISATYCVKQPPSFEACPADLSAAGKICVTPGKACYYKSACPPPGSKVDDNCYCEGVAGLEKDGGTSVKLRWVCTPAPCN